MTSHCCEVKNCGKTRQIDRGNQNKAGGVQFGAESAVARRLYFKKPVFIWRIWRSGIHCRKVRIQMVFITWVFCSALVLCYWMMKKSLYLLSTCYDIKEFHRSFSLVNLSLPSLVRPERWVTYVPIDQVLRPSTMAWNSLWYIIIWISGLQ